MLASSKTRSPSYVSVCAECTTNSLLSFGSRATQTSAQIFSQDTAVPIHVISTCLEGWCERPEHRARPTIAALLTGTETGSPGEPQRWPSLRDLNVEDRLQGLEEIYESGEEQFAPGASHRPPSLSQLAELQRHIIAAPGRRLAVVCDESVLLKLFDISETPDCGVLRTWWWTDADGGVRTAKGSSRPEPPPGYQWECSFSAADQLQCNLTASEANATQQGNAA